MTPTKNMTRAVLAAIFAQAVRAIGKFEAQRRDAMLAIEIHDRSRDEKPEPPTP